MGYIWFEIAEGCDSVRCEGGVGRAKKPKTKLQGLGFG